MPALNALPRLLTGLCELSNDDRKLQLLAIGKIESWIIGALRMNLQH